ncbi:transposase [Agrobacterium tumefaciens]|uniref:transposase n=1 Tax=Agrobacterium tumefaciens TaxID=358 RepID=UPI00157247AC|nr:transposase [Agrobacterium tumefaciens]
MIARHQRHRVLSALMTGRGVAITDMARSFASDLERRKTIALLPDREATTAKAWLIQQPKIEIVARDRGGSYTQAASQTLPHADQITDRWHLMENASRRSRKSI